MKTFVPGALAVFFFLAIDCHAGEGDRSSPVDTILEQVSRDLQKLSRQYDNPASRDSSIVLADAVIAAAEKAKQLQPAAAEKLSGPERDDYMATYHEGMDELLARFVALKQALEADETGAAEAAIEEAYKLREKYHTELDVR